MAAKTKEQLELEYQSFIPYIESLGALADAHWEAPIGAGKWSLKEMLLHIMLWDKYFYEEAFAKVKEGQPVTAKHQNFNEFNARAIEYAKPLTKQSAIQEFVQYRKKIVDVIMASGEEEFAKIHLDGDRKKFSFQGYLRDFIPHDKHHKKQMEQYIQSIMDKQTSH